MSRCRALVAVAIACALSACAGNGEGLDQNGRPVSGGGGGDQPLVAELQSIQDHVFTPICTACHIGASAPLGFRLDADSAYAMLVNTPSAEVPSLLRVNPGNPDSSYIIQKLEGHAAVGAQMPLGQTPLPQATIDVIRQWITDGAQPSAAGLSAPPPLNAGSSFDTALAMAGAGGASAQAPSVAEGSESAASALHIRAISPLEEETLDQAPREILLAANGELDVTSLHASSLHLQRSGADGGFDEGNEVSVPNMQITVHSLDPTVLALTLPAEAWVPDTYRLTIAGHGETPATSRTGAPIADFTLQFNVGAAR